MESAEELGGGRGEFARRFLQTAVVVDDQAYMTADRSDGPKGEVATPGRRALASSQEDPGPVGRRSEHTLNARSVIDSFSELGVICGVVGPTQSAMEVMRQADIVVLDWLLEDGDPQHALRLLHDLLDEEVDRNSLRLVAIYTGEARLEDICAAVVDELSKTGLDPEEIESKGEVLNLLENGRGCILVEDEPTGAGRGRRLEGGTPWRREYRDRCARANPFRS